MQVHNKVYWYQIHRNKIIILNKPNRGEEYRLKSKGLES